MSTVRISAPTIVPPKPPRPPMIDVPPMTAAATDGSTYVSASVTLATLVRPEMQEPGDRRQERRDDVQDDQDLPRAGARQARRDRVVADRVQQPAVPGPPER